MALYKSVYYYYLNAFKWLCACRVQRSLYCDLRVSMSQNYRVAQNKHGLFTVVVHVLYFYNRTHKYDNVRVAARTLVNAVLDVSSTGCNKERQSFAKLSYSTIDNVLTNLLPAGLQNFCQVTTTVNKLLKCPPDRTVYWV